MNFPKHYLAAVSAFIIWGFFSIVLKPLHNYPSLDILFYRVFMCIGIMAIINLLLRRKKIAEARENFKKMDTAERRNQWLLIAGSSVLLTANWFYFIFVMNHISVKAASFAYLVCPIITTVMAFFILKEKLTKIQWLAVSISIISCTILSYNNLHDALYSILVAATYALYLVMQKRIVMADRFLLLTIQIGITALLLLPFFPYYGGPVPREPLFYAFIAIIAIGFTIVPMLLNLFALKGINSSTVGILIYLNPLIAFTLALVYYREDITAEQIISYSLIIISIIIFNIGAYIKLRHME